MSYSNTSKHTTRKTAFAVGAVLVLVGVAFAASMFFSGSETAQINDFGSGDATDPVTSLAALSTPLPDVQGEADAAVASMSATSAEGEARLASASSDAQARIDAATSNAGILAGAEGDVDAALAVPGSYTVGDLQARIDGMVGTSFVWTSMPSTVTLAEGSMSFEETGDAQVDDALAQIGSLVSEARAAYTTGEAQTVFATVDSTLADAGAPISLPGLVKSPFGAQSAIEPDQDGARAAAAHADAFLGTLDAGYGDLETSMSSFEAAANQLPADVNTAFDGANAFQAEATTTLEAEFETRVAAVQGAAADYEAAVNAAAEQYGATVESEAASVQSDLEAEVVAQQTSLEANATKARSTIEARAAEIRSEADTRTEAIAALEAQVTAMADAGTIAQIDAQVFLVTSATAKVQIEAQASAAEAQAVAAVASIEAEVEAQQAALESAAADAQSGLDARVLEAQAWAQSQAAMLTGEVDGAVSVAMVAQADARAEAQAAVDSYAATYKAEVMSQALDVLAAARAEAGGVQDVIPQVNAEAYSEINKDLDYIQSVVDDYSAVPTPERQAAADAWAQAHGEIDGELGAALMLGSSLQAQVDVVLKAAASAEAELSAIA